MKDIGLILSRQVFNLCKEQKINGQISMKFDRANNLLNEDIVKGISEEVVKESKNITDKSNKNKVNTKNSTNKNKRTKEGDWI